MRKVIKTIIEGLALVSVFFGIGALAGACENGTNWIVPLILLVLGFGTILGMEKADEIKVHDCTNHCDDTFRPTFLH